MNERRRTLLFSKSNIPTENGVYIESVEHEFYLANDWDTTNTANSIAVVTDAHSFRIALSGTSLSMSANYTDPWETYLSGTTNSGITDLIAANTDYSGATNTKLIIEKCQPSTTYAAGWCNAYTFPDGKTKGYLPALGELNIAYHNKDEVGAALAKCGGRALPSDYHWSSTFSDVNRNFRYCWYFNWYGGSVGGVYLSYNGYVRPFALL